MSLHTSRDQSSDLQATRTQGPGTDSPPPLSEAIEVDGYRILGLLGKGGMGSVYEAEHLESGRIVALKVMHQVCADPREQQRFLREGQLAATISHTNCVFVFGVEQTAAGQPVIAMERVDGGNLKDKVAREGPMSPKDAVAAIQQVIAGLEAAHEAGILHRDVKPANCFIDACSGDIKIGDFGISRSSSPNPSRIEDAETRSSGSFAGTPAFASPEQLQAAPKLDHRSDIYSVGATLYFLLTGQPPFTEIELIPLVAAIAGRAPAPPSQLNRAVPEDLNALVLRCLAKSPDDRFATYADLRAALPVFEVQPGEPVRPELRLIGGVIDSMLRSVPGFVLLSRSVGPPDVLDGAWIAAIVSLAFGLMEGLWGTSPGKRVIGAWLVHEGRKPGLTRAIARSLLFGIPMVAPSLLFHWGFGVLASLSMWLLLVAMFLSARTKNGWSGLHDLATGIRTVRHARAVNAERQCVSLPAAPPPSPEWDENAPAVGPYRIVKHPAIPPPEGFVEGWDPQLARRAWIRSAPTPVSEARRRMHDPSRLRWLGGQAFEFPGGVPLSQLPRQPWSVVSRWLLQLSESLTANPIPANLRATDVWIRANGRALLLDLDTTGEPVPARAFLKEVALASLRDPAAIPAHAAPLFHEGDDTSIAGLLRKHAGASEIVTPLRRFGQIFAAWIAVSLMMLVSITLTFSSASTRRIMELSIFVRGLAELPPGDQNVAASYLREEYRRELDNPQTRQILLSDANMKSGVERVLQAPPMASFPDPSRGKAALEKFNVFPRMWETILRKPDFVLGFMATIIGMGELFGLFWILVLGAPVSMRIWGLALVRMSDGAPVGRMVLLCRGLLRIVSLVAFIVAGSFFATRLLGAASWTVLVIILGLWSAATPYRGPMEYLFRCRVARE